MISGVGPDTLSNAALTMMVRALEDRADKADNALARERRDRAAQEDKTLQLVEELRREVAELQGARGSGVDGAAAGKRPSPGKGKQKQKTLEPIENGSPRRCVFKL